MVRDPQQQGFPLTHILPSMHGTLEIQTVAGLQNVPFDFIQPDLEQSLEHINEPHTVMIARVPTARSGQALK